MNWLLLATPVIGIVLLIAGIRLSHRFLPLVYLDETGPAEEIARLDYEAIVAKTADTLGRGVVAVIRRSMVRSSAVQSGTPRAAAAPGAEESVSPAREFATAGSFRK